MADQRYPHVSLREEDDSPRPLRNVTNRMLEVISRSYRGFVGQPTYVSEDNFLDVIGKTDHRGSVALEAMFGTFNPDQVLFRRVTAQFAKAESETGIKVLAGPTGDDDAFTLELADGTTSESIAVTATDGWTLAQIADAIVDAIQAQSTLVDAMLDPQDISNATIKLIAKAPGFAGNSITFKADLTAVANGLNVTPGANQSLKGGTDGPVKAKLEIPTAGTGKWVVVSNFPGLCGNDLAINVYQPASNSAMFSLDLVDTFRGNRVTRFPNIQPQKADFQNDGSGYGYRFLKLANDFITLYYDGDLADIQAPATLPAQPPTLPAVQASLTGGDDGSAVMVEDYLREIAASAEDEVTIVCCPDDLPATQKQQINAALRTQAKASIELTGLRQAVVQVPLGVSLQDDLNANGDQDGFVVSVCTRHTGSWRPELPPDSYTGDIFVAAAMATKTLHVSLADRQNVAPVSGLSSTTVNGVDPSKNVQLLNTIQDTGHEAIVFDPGTRAYQFLTGRALAPDQGKHMSRSQNRQLENQFRTDIWFMLQYYKSQDIAGQLPALREQVDNYFDYQKNVVKSIAGYKATVADRSNNPVGRQMDGWARADFFWAPKLIGDKIEGVIHTYVESGV